MKLVLLLCRLLLLFLLPLVLQLAVLVLACLLAPATLSNDDLRRWDIRLGKRPVLDDSTAGGVFAGVPATNPVLLRPVLLFGKFFRDAARSSCRRGLAVFDGRIWFSC